jgi:DNA-binding FrmR family transcriptional regulator
MTRFEGQDLQTQPAVFDTGANSGAKFHEDYLSTVKDQTQAGNGDAKFVKVADDKVAQAASPGDQPQAGDDQQGQNGKDQSVGVKEILTADPKELPPHLRTIQGLADHFNKADDKAKAMGEVKPEMDKAVQGADDGFAAAQVKADAASKTLKPQFEAVSQALEAAKGDVQKSMAAVPEKDRKHVASEAMLLLDPQTSPGVKKAIEVELKAQKGLVPAVKEMVAAEKAAEPVMAQVQALQKEMNAAQAEPILSRMIYADMLEQSGDKAGAKAMQAESMALQLGMPIEQFRKMQKQKEEQDKAKGN